MRFIKEAILLYIGWNVYAFAWCITLLPDKMLGSICIFFFNIRYPFVDNPDEVMALKELSIIFNAGPPGSTALKNMVHVARPSQVFALIRGVIIHHLVGRKCY